MTDGRMHRQAPPANLYSGSANILPAPGSTKGVARGKFKDRLRFSPMGIVGAVAIYTDLLTMGRALAALGVAGWLTTAALARSATVQSATVHRAVPAVPDKGLTIKTVAEVQSRIAEGGAQVARLVPADRVVPGDLVFYTLEVRNTGALAPAPVVTSAIPAHTSYIAGSAVGPGAEVSFSVDGGLTFEPAQKLIIKNANGHGRPAVAADYTHVRWHLNTALNAHAVTFVRFRAVVR